MPVDPRISPIHLPTTSGAQGGNVVDVRGLLRELSQQVTQSLDGLLGLSYRDLLEEARFPQRGVSTAALVEQVNRELVRVRLDQLGYRQVSIDFASETPVDPAQSHELFRALRRVRDAHVRVAVNHDQVPALFDYFMNLSRVGFQPLTERQAGEMRRRSTRIVELGAGAGFNAALLRAVAPGGSVRAFDSGVHTSDKSRLTYAQDGQSIGGPVASEDLTALKQWVYEDPSRYLKGWLRRGRGEITDDALLRARAIVMSFTPKYDGGSEVGSAEVLRDSALAEHDLFLCFPPTVTLVRSELVHSFDRDGFVDVCLRNLSSRARFIYMMSGSTEAAWKYPDRLLATMSRAGWRPDTVVPSTFPSNTGSNDLWVFERKGSTALPGSKDELVERPR